MSSSSLNTEELPSVTTPTSCCDSISLIREMNKILVTNKSDDKSLCNESELKVFKDG